MQTVKLSLLFTEYCELDSSWNYSNIYSPFSRLYLITAGTGEIVFNTRKVQLEADNLYLIPSFTKHAVRTSSFIHQYYICFFEKFENELGLYNYLKFKDISPAGPMDHLLFKRLLELNPNMQLPEADPVKYDNSRVMYSKQHLIQNQSEKDYLETHGILIQFLSRFVEMQTADDIERRGTMMKMSKVLKYISSNLHNPITLDDLSKTVFLSPEYLCRVFRKNMGESPIEYINRKRIEKAQELLFENVDNISTIAAKCGFNSVSNFNKFFKRITSMKPSEYKSRSYIFKK